MPRQGLGSIDVSSLGGAGQDVVTTIDDFFFESQTSGEVTPFPTADRTNRLAYSEDFSQTGVYGRTNVDVAVNTTAAPNGTLTADTVTPTTTNGIHTLSMTGTNTVAMSVFAKANGYNMFRFNTGSSSNGRATFDLSDGTIHATSGTFFSKASIEDHGNGWYRCSCVIVGGSATNMTIAIENGLDQVAFAADGTSGIHFWGAQSEDNTETTAYIPTTNSTVTVTPALNDTSEVWDFDTRDIMLEEDPEDEGFWEEGSNLVLNHDYADIGSNLITDGDFPVGTTAWSRQDGNISVSGEGGEGKVTMVGASNYVHQTFNTTSGKVYEGSFTFRSGNSNSLKGFITLRNGANSDSSLSTFFTTGSRASTSVFESNRIASGTGTFMFTAGNSTTSIRLNTEKSGVPAESFFSNISIKEVDPNDRWTLGTGWSIFDGKAVFSGTDFANLQLSSTILTIGDTYELTLTAEITNGSFKVQHSGSSDLITESSSGTYSVIFTATATSFTIARASVGSQNDFTIDNVTVREYAVQPKDI